MRKNEKELDLKDAKVFWITSRWKNKTVVCLIIMPDISKRDDIHNNAQRTRK